MKILRFRHPPASDRDTRAGSARLQAGGNAVANGLRPAADAATRSRSGAAAADKRYLVALAMLGRPAVEALLARRAPARRVLAAFRSQEPFGHAEPPEPRHL